MKSGEILFLNQLVNSLVDAGEQLEKANAKEDYEEFNKFKKIIFKVQGEISELTR